VAGVPRRIAAPCGALPRRRRQLCGPAGITAAARCAPRQPVSWRPRAAGVRKQHCERPCINKRWRPLSLRAALLRLSCFRPHAWAEAVSRSVCVFFFACHLRPPIVCFCDRLAGNGAARVGGKCLVTNVVNQRRCCFRPCGESHRLTQRSARPALSPLLPSTSSGPSFHPSLPLSRRPDEVDKALSLRTLARLQSRRLRSCSLSWSSHGLRRRSAQPCSETCGSRRKLAQWRRRPHRHQLAHGEPRRMDSNTQTARCGAGPEPVLRQKSGVFWLSLRLVSQ
jgi:hypothetical protein